MNWSQTQSREKIYTFLTEKQVILSFDLIFELKQLTKLNFSQLNG